MATSARVAIIGRANVGKSTLFNRLSSGPKALVSDIAGTTRDRKENDCYWLGKTFTIIDTGGLDVDAHNPIEQMIAEQATVAALDADLILFVVDSKVGITPVDTSVAKLLRTKIKKPVLLVANKVDGKRDIAATNEFYQLGLGEPLPVSAATGSGTGDLLDTIARHIPMRAASDEQTITVALIGKPNVGKSSLVNALVGQERSIVYDEPYTTRDANMIRLTYEGQSITLIDTAGIRRKAKIDRGGIEKESVDQSLESIRTADVILFMTEAQKKITAQDRQLAQLIHDSNAAVIMIGNKWDLIPDKDELKANEFTKYYKQEFNFIDWAPIIFMSAQEKTKLTRLKQAIVLVYHEKFRKIEDNAMNKFLKVILKKHKPTVGKGVHKPYIYRLKQMGVNPPQFVVQIGEDTSLNYTYLNYIETQLREKFGFAGSPIKIWVEKYKTQADHVAGGKRITGKKK